MIRRLITRLRHAATTHATVGGHELRHRTAKSLRLCGNTEQHDAVELTDLEREQVADIERRWNGGDR